MAQPSARVYRVGYLGTTAVVSAPGLAAFRQTLGEMGWVEGRNLAIDARFSEGVSERFAELAAELVRHRVDVITTGAGWTAVRAAKQATTTTPVVMLGIADPVALGLIASLARPGGNVTGVADLSTELTAKRLDLLKQTLPRITRVVYVTCAALQDAAAIMALREEQIAAARGLGLDLRFVEVKNLQDFPQASVEIVRERPEGLLLGPCPIIFGLRREFAEFALTRRLPTVASARLVAEAGALMSYGTDGVANFRRGAAIVDKILRGAAVSDLPVEQPTTFDLVVNLKTARALGLAIPPSLRLRASEVME
jgi:putative ABC transport system substrate-binding protein